MEPLLVSQPSHEACHKQLSYVGECRSYETERTAENIFFRNVKWCSDGSCLSACNDQNVLSLFYLPLIEENIKGICERLSTQYASCEDGGCDTKNDISSDNSQNTVDSNDLTQQLVLHPWTSFVGSDYLYDHCWHPKMKRDAPDTCMIAISCRGLPIYLINAFDCSIRSTYKFFNLSEEVVSPIFLTFTPSGNYLYGGVKNTLYISHLDQPERQIESRSFKKKLKESSFSPKSVLSAIAFQSSQYDGSSLYAVGNYVGDIFLHDARNRTSEILLFSDSYAIPRGVSQLTWLTPESFLSGHRMDNYIRCWDIRYNSSPSVYYPRDTDSCQKYSFATVKGSDIRNKLKSDEEKNDSPPGLMADDSIYLLSGDKDGCLTVYDVMTGTAENSFKIHSSPCNSVDVNPHLPLVVTSAGTRVVPTNDQLFETGNQNSIKQSLLNASCDTNSLNVSDPTVQYNEEQIAQRRARSTFADLSTQEVACNELLDNSCRIWRFM